MTFRSPVHFQPLERELEPVAKYLGGHMLNAGCGTRDIDVFLKANGVREVTRYDIASADPGVVIGPIEAMPFDDASFDSVLCNAVLEHVHDAERGIRELTRVVREGGYVIVTVPFLQPYHPSPGDFRRYTADGLAQLGRRAGLDVIEVLPVHSLAQTLSWILWEYEREKGGTLRKCIAWALAFVISHLRTSTERRVFNNANTFQAVFRKPELSEAAVIGTDWRYAPLPAACEGVRTMLVPDELRLLRHLGESYFSGRGAIVDAGCFAGGSTVALAEGVRRNPARRDGVIHSYDRFELEPWMRGIYFSEDAPDRTSFRDEFDRNVAAYGDLIEVHAGDITQQSWSGGPIEILFVDVAKSPATCDWVTWNFFPHLIPGRSLVVQQDYLYHEWVAWLHVTMELYADYFEYVCDTNVNSVVFLNTKAIPPSVLRRNSVESLSFDEKVALMDRAANRFDGAKRELLLAAKAHFVDMLKAS